MEIPIGSDTITSKQAPVHEGAHRGLLEGIHFRFPIYRHDHPPVVDVNEVADDQLTFGQRIADVVAKNMGSWRFIIIQSLILVLWIILNSVAWFVWKWDIYPFIAMNLVLSCQAAYAAPIIMMSQNRQSTKDRLTAENDYVTDCKGEEEIRHIMDHLDHQDVMILQVLQRIEAQREELLKRLGTLDPALAQRLGTDILHISEEMAEEETGDSSMSGNS